MSIFTDIQFAFADALNSSPEDAGIFAGLILICVLAVIAYWAIQDVRAVFLVAISGAIFAIGIGWWPTWTAILLAIACAVLLFRLPGDAE